VERIAPQFSKYDTPGGLENTYDKAMWALQERMRERMRQLCSNFFDAIDDSLFSSSEQAGCYDKQQEFISAMREIRTKQKHFVEDYIDRINYLFQYSSPQKAGIPGVDPTDRDSLDSEKIFERMELDLALKAMLGKGKRTYGNYISRIAKHKNFANYCIGEHNPTEDLLLTQSIEAFAYASNIFDISLEIRLVVFKLFEKHFLMKIEKIYLDILVILDKLSDERFVNKLYQSTTSFRNKKFVKEQAGPYSQTRQAGEIASIQINLLVDERIEQLCAHQGLPDFIENMFMHCWRSVLFVIGLNEGSSSGAWKLATETSENLVCLIESTGEEGMANIDTDTLEDALRDGFDLVMMKKQDQDEFFRQMRDVIEDPSKGRQNTSERKITDAESSLETPVITPAIFKENQPAEENTDIGKLNAEDMAEIMELMPNSDEQQSQMNIHRQPLLQYLKKVDRIHDGSKLEFVRNNVITLCRVRMNRIEKHNFEIIGEKGEFLTRRNRFTLAVSLQGGELRLVQPDSTIPA